VRRAALLLLVGLAAVGVLLLFVFPLQNLMGQRQQIRQTEQRIAALRKEDAALAARVRGLRSPAAVERLAHKDFGMVGSVQKAYTVVPSAPNTTTTTSTTTTTVPRRVTRRKEAVAPTTSVATTTTAPTTTAPTRPG